MDFTKYTEVLRDNLLKNADCLSLKEDDALFGPQKKELKNLQEIIKTLPSEKLFIKSASVTKIEDSIVVNGLFSGRWTLSTINSYINFDNSALSLSISYDMLYQAEKVEITFEADLTFNSILYRAVVRYGLNSEGKFIWKVEPVIFDNPVNALSVLKAVVPAHMQGIFPEDIPAFSNLRVGGVSNSGLSVEFFPNHKEPEIVSIEATSHTELELISGKVSIRNLGVESRTRKALFDENGKLKEGSSTKFNLVGKIDIGSKTCVVKFLVSSSGIEVLDAYPDVGNEFPSFSELGSLLGGTDLENQINHSFKLVRIKNLTLDRVRIAFDLKKKTLNYVSCQSHAWFFNRRFDLSINFPDLSFYGNLAEGENVKLKLLLKEILGDSSSFPDLDVTDIQIYYGGKRKGLRVNIRIETDVELPLVSGQSIMVHQLEFELNKLDNTSWGRASCFTEMFGIDLQLSLQKNGPEEGWRIKANMPSDEVIEFRKLRYDLTRLFNSDIPLPQLLINSKVQYVNFEYDPSSKSMAFSGEVTTLKPWKIKIGSSNIELYEIQCFYSKLNAESETSISTRLNIGSVELVANFQQPGPILLRSSIPDISFLEILKPLSKVNFLKNLPVPDHFFDVSMIDSEMEIDIDNKSAVVSGYLKGLGYFQAAFIKRREREVVLDFTLSEGFSFSSIKNDLSFLDVVNLEGGQLIFSSFSTQPGEAVEVAGSALSVIKGINVSLPADIFKLEALSFFNVLIGAGNQDKGGNSLLTGNIQPTGQWLLEASIPSFEIIKGIRIQRAGVRLRSTMIGRPEVGLFGQFELAIDDPHLFFEVSANLEPGGKDIQGYLEEWDTPFGIKGIHVKRLRLIIGTNLAGVPTLGATGQVALGDVKGSAAVVFDSKDASQCMAAFKFKQLSLGIILRSLFSPIARVPKAVTYLADVVQLKDVDFRVVPPGVQFEEYKKGVSLDGNLLVGIGPFKIKGTSEGVVELPKGIYLNGYFEPVKLGSIIKIKGEKSKENPKGGPGFSLDLLLANANPEIKLDGEIFFLGLSGIKGKAFLSTKQLAFQFNQKQGPISYRIACKSNDFQKVQASGDFKLGLNLSINAQTIEVLGVDVPVWPSFKLNRMLAGKIILNTEISRSPTVKVALKKMGFSFHGQSFSVPDISFSVRSKDFENLPDLIEQHILDNIEKIFKALIDEARKQALSVLKNINKLADKARKEIESIVNNAVSEVKNLDRQAISLARGAANLVRDIDRLDRTAENLAKNTGELANRGIKEIENMGRHITSISGPITTRAIQYSRQVEAIGKTMAKQAKRYARTAQKIVEALFNALNPANWF